MIETDRLQQLIIEGIQERKGRAITLVDLSHIDSASAREFIIAEGTSRQQVSAIAESVADYVRINGSEKPFNADGADGDEWIVLDYGDIWVHIFTREARLYYKLEDLWNDARITEVPDLD